MHGPPNLPNNASSRSTDPNVPKCFVCKRTLSGPDCDCERERFGPSIYRPGNIAPEIANSHSWRTYSDKLSRDDNNQKQSVFSQGNSQKSEGLFGKSTTSNDNKNTTNTYDKKTDDKCSVM